MPPRRGGARRARPAARPPSAAAPRVAAVRDADHWARLLALAGEGVVCVAFTSVSVSIGEWAGKKKGPPSLRPSPTPPHPPPHTQSWSAPARQARAFFTDVARRPAFTHVSFAAVDLGDAAASALATSLGVTASPAFQLWKCGRLLRNLSAAELVSLPAVLADVAGPPPTPLLTPLRAAVAATVAAVVGMLLSRRADAANLASMPPEAAAAVRAERAATRAAKKASRVAGRRRIPLPLPGTGRRAAAAVFKGDAADAAAEAAGEAAAAERGVPVGAVVDAMRNAGSADASIEDVASVLAEERTRLVYGRRLLDLGKA